MTLCPITIIFSTFFFSLLLEANKFLLFSRIKDLHTVPLQQDPPTDLPDIVLPVSDITSAGAVDWDSDSNAIFWADDDRGTISMSHITVSVMTSL